MFNYDKNKNLNIEYVTSNLFYERRTIQYRFKWLLDHFNIVKSKSTLDTKSISVILVHDEITQEIIHRYEFSEVDRTNAVKEFEALTKKLDFYRYNVLLFNTYLIEALQVTHPKFYI